MTRRRMFTAIALAAALTSGVSGCGSATTPETAVSPSSTATTGAVAAEIAFAQGMIPHHEQAVEMADLALAPGAQASPEVKELARQIKSAQDPEIQQMTGWLQRWGAPTQMPGASGEDMAGMDHGGHDMGGMTMSGMMTDEQMQDLMQATGPDFDTMWQEMMIAHHEGAVQMAEQVKGASADPEVTELANQIISAQKSEIATMQQSLDSA